MVRDDARNFNLYKGNNFSKTTLDLLALFKRVACTYNKVWSDKELAEKIEWAVFNSDIIKQRDMLLEFARNIQKYSHDYHLVLKADETIKSCEGE